MWLRSIAESSTDTPGSRRGRLRNALDGALAQLGLTRQVVAAVPTEAAAVAFVRGTDLVAAVP